jgi:AraC family transcriptional activator of tynA and feaB
VALSCAQDVQAGNAQLSSAGAAALLNLQAAIESRLFDPALTPSCAAAAGGISVRHANALLAQEGTSLERHILERRLQRCRTALEDPAQSHRTIAEIAFAWGFSSASHFSHRFKERFAATPTERRGRGR